MPLTPATWLDEFIVNLTTTGSQMRPRVTHLANGNIVVVWQSDDDSGVGSPAGSDIIGQIFDPVGTRIGGEFLVNVGVSGELETVPDVSALPGGGFLTVFAGQNGALRDVFLTEHDASGTVVATLAPFLDIEEDTIDGITPRVAVASDTSALVVWVEPLNGSSRGSIVGTIYDASTNTLGARISLLAFTGDNSEPEVTTMTNGNFVIVATRNNGGDNEIVLRIVDSAGNNVLGASFVAVTRGNGQNDREPSVTALTGGGFVITWTNTDANDTDIQAQIYSAAGFLQGSINVTLGGETDNANESSVVALADGGFVVFFDDDALGELRGKRYDSTGGVVADEFTIATGGGAIGEIDAELMDDGRVVVTFELANGEIGMEIIDIRDAPSTAYSPQSRIGTIGDDIMLADGVSAFVYGHDGNDTIQAGAAGTYYGGAGDDMMLSSTFSTFMIGGAGVDTIDFRAFDGDNQIDMTTGLTNYANESYTEFENVIMGNGTNVVTGTIGDNVITGGSGQDTLHGGLGIDTVSYFNAAAAITIDLRNSTSLQNTVGAGLDKLTGIENVIGSDHNDTLISDLNVANALRGGLGNDRYYLYQSLDQAIEAAGQGTADRVEAFANVTIDAASEIETMIARLTTGMTLGGSDTANRIDGNIGGDTLNGNGGGDTLNGLAGDDTLNGGDGNDILTGGDNNDALNGGADNDTASYAAAGGAVTVSLLIAVQQATGAAGNDTLTSIENLTGSGYGDTLTGSNAVNIIVGGAGNDTINGRGDADIMSGGTGDDKYYVDNLDDEVYELSGQGNADKVYASTDYVLLAGQHIEFLFANAGATGLSLTGNELANNVQGNTGNDTLFGEDGNDVLDGRTGSDDMYGGAGNDKFYVSEAGDKVFEAGEGTLDIAYVETGFFQLGAAQEVERIYASNGANATTLIGNELANALFGGAGSDRLEGGDGGDVLTGNGGADRLVGGAGMDTLFGNAGNDVFVLRNLAADRDTIRDFVAANDQIEISASLFGGGLINGVGLSTDQFISNATGLAEDAEDRFIYSTSNGALYFDIDGTGMQARVQIATLTGIPTLGFADFSIVF